MPFNLFFLSGEDWIPPTLRGDGNVVYIKEDNVLRDEHIFVWELDDEGKKEKLPISERLRIQMKEMGVAPKICDGAFVYKKRGNNYITLCLVELKGGDLPRAMKQINSTKNALVKLLESNIDILNINNKLLSRIVWRAFIKIGEDSSIKQEQSGTKKKSNSSSKKNTSKPPPKSKQDIKNKKRSRKKSASPRNKKRIMKEELKPLRDNGFDFADYDRNGEIGSVLR